MIATQDSIRAEVVEHYRICGVEFRLEAESATVAADIVRRLQMFSTDEEAVDPFVLTIRRDEPQRATSAPAGMRELARGKGEEGFDAVLFGGAGLRRIEVPDRFSLDLNLIRRKATIVVAPGYESWVFNFALLPAMRNCFRRAGLQVLHAACLSWNDGQSSPTGLLIVGQSGAGKTTTALALAYSGLTLETDEMTIFTADGSYGAGSPTICGFPRACHVRSGTFDLLPALRRLPLQPTPERGTVSVELDNLPGGMHRAGAQGFRLGLIVCLDPPNPEGHRVQTLDPARALHRLAHENVGLVGLGEEDIGCRTFQGLASLVRSTPACRLSAGPKLDDVHQVLLPLLKRSNA